MTVGELARHYRLSPSSVYDAIYAGRLPGVVRFGKAVRIERKAIEEQVSRTGQMLLPAAE